MFEVASLPLERLCAPKAPHPTVTRSLALELARSAGRDGEAFYLQQDLAERLRVTPRTINRALVPLLAAGVLEVKPRGYKGRWSATYVILLGREAAAEKQKSAEESTFVRHECRAEIVEAYRAARIEVHGLSLVGDSRGAWWDSLEAFCVELGREIGLAAGEVARRAMRAYCDLPGFDGGLRKKHHPIKWWPGYADELEQAVRRSVRSESKAGFVRMREVVSSSRHAPGPSLADGMKSIADAARNSTNVTLARAGSWRSPQQEAQKGAAPHRAGPMTVAAVN